MSAAPTLELSDTVLRAVRGRHAFEGCVEQLATAIRLGVYARGSALPPERDLAERMGVSRATLREAIAALRAAEFVSTTRGRGGGTVVSYRARKPSARGARALAPRSDHLRDTLVFRRVVEPGAAHTAASRDLTPAQQELLVGAHDDVSSATDPAEHRQADSRFHLAVAAVTESPLIVRSVTALHADLHDMLNAIPVLAVNIDHSDKQHRLILGAVLRGDATKARRVMESHCDDTAALLRGLLT
ncbi:MAG TPA: FCD domain-containing protein [Nocardioidaceae bacterium]|nr:FCD domain-containing protein [Nocardioidaceae bacterium]